MKHRPLCVVHFILPYPFLTADTTRVSIGAGSALSSREIALVGKASGCGSDYLVRQYYTFRCIFGRKVSGRSMKGTSFIGGTLIRGLDTRRGGQHWEFFCKQLPLES